MLHVLLFAPFVAAGLMLLSSGRDAVAASRMALTLAGVVLLVGIYALLAADQLIQIPWFTLPGTGATSYYALELDGMSRWLSALTLVLTPIALLAAKPSTGDRMREFAVGVFALQGCLIGAFLAADLVLFYVLFEAMLIPTAILIAMFGDGERKKAIMRFVMYTMAGSALFLVSIWYLAGQFETTLIPELIARNNEISPEAATCLFLAMSLAFVVKTPLFPFHGWQAPVYASCPTGVAVLVAGVMAKLGPYGLLRIVLPLFPAEAVEYQTWFITLGLIGIVGGACMALVQSDLKRILAYSSLSHLGLIVVGIFAFNDAAASGAVLQMVAHGLAAAALFMIVGALEQRVGSRRIGDFGGVVSQAPVLGTFFVAAALAAVALPGTAGFAGEFLLLAGIYQGLGETMSSGSLIIIFILAGLGLILGAGYTLRVVQRVNFGKAPEGRKYFDLNPAEGLGIAVLLAGSLILGIAPKFVLNQTDATLPAALSDADPVPALAGFNDIRELTPIQVMANEFPNDIMDSCDHGSCTSPDVPGSQLQHSQLQHSQLIATSTSSTPSALGTY